VEADMPSFLSGLVVTILLIVGIIFVYDFSPITEVEDAHTPGVHVSDR
jgi:hypothetical protein